MLSLVKTLLFSVLRQGTNEYLDKNNKRRKKGKKELRDIQMCVSGIISVLALTDLVRSISSN